MLVREHRLPDEQATMALGQALARALDARNRLVVHLQGELGAGKTTLVRALLRAMGHTGPVRSPTYTLMEPYELAGRHCLHLDLYRLADPGELEYIGLRELMSGPVLVLVEWPDRGKGLLPEPDLVLALAYAECGRQLRAEALSAAGEQLLQGLSDNTTNS